MEAQTSSHARLDRGCEIILSRAREMDARRTHRNDEMASRRDGAWPGVVERMRTAMGGEMR